MSLHGLVSMKRTKQDKKRANAEHTVGEEAFPFGLTISLDDDSLTKLGIDELPAVGEEWIVVGIGKIDSVSKNERDNSRGVNRNVSIQLQKLEVGPLEAKTATDAVSAAIKEA